MTAVAIKDDMIAPSLGAASVFILAEGEKQEKAELDSNLFAFLRTRGVDTLICCGIGICTLEMLEKMNIKVIPGIKGDPAEALELLRKNRLQAGENYSCAQMGRTCGDCKGNY